MCPPPCPPACPPPLPRWASAGVPYASDTITITASPAYVFMLPPALSSRLDETDSAFARQVRRQREAVDLRHVFLRTACWQLIRHVGSRAHRSAVVRTGVQSAAPVIHVAR